MISNLNLDSLSGLSDRSNFKLADSEAIQVEVSMMNLNLNLKEMPSVMFTGRVCR